MDEYEEAVKATASSDRSPVGSIAARSRPAASCPRPQPHPTARRSAPLRHGRARWHPARVHSLIRPLAGRLHCGIEITGPQFLRREGLIRPLAGRLHCGGDLEMVPPGLVVALIRPLAGRLHCGRPQLLSLLPLAPSSDRSPVGSIAAAVARRTPQTWTDTSSDRSPVGSIAASEYSQPPPALSVLIRPLAGRLHCGVSILGGVGAGFTASSDRSPVGSIAAASPAQTPPRQCPPHPTARRSAPLRLRHVDERFGDGQPHPTARRSAPLRRGRAGRTGRRRGCSSDRSPVGSIAAQPGPLSL